jgi:hypothetical protein
MSAAAVFMAGSLAVLTGCNKCDDCERASVSDEVAPAEVVEYEPGIRSSEYPAARNWGVAPQQQTETKHLQTEEKFSRRNIRDSAMAERRAAFREHISKLESDIGEIRSNQQKILEQLNKFQGAPDQGLSNSINKLEAGLSDLRDNQKKILDQLSNLQAGMPMRHETSFEGKRDIEVPSGSAIPESRRDLQKPSVTEPSVSVPSVSTPSVSTPSVSAPSVSTPSVSVPDTGTSGTGTDSGMDRNIPSSDSSNTGY